MITLPQLELPISKTNGSSVENATAPAVHDRDSALVSYAYSYPHKSAYRPLEPAVPLSDIWRDEDVSQLALYVHIPFCETRCGFCNLFTQSQPESEQMLRYLATVQREIEVVRRQVPQAHFGTFAMGGGTPTYLSPQQLHELFELLESRFELELRSIPTSIETSPATATNDRLRVLAERGIERVSLGVQSFERTETQRFGRPQSSSEVHRALSAIREFAFPRLNVDLIYGDAAQTRASWLNSLAAAEQYHPEEFYLYPLYVRPETGLAQVGRQAAEHRVDLYRAGRDWLLERGYEQVSLRCFQRRSDRATETQPATASHYSCQQDGMIGLGCGARSYTGSLHYSSRFAVTQAGVRAILNSWIAQSDDELGLATHGIRLSLDEQRRRFVILSLLQVSGLKLSRYSERFGSNVQADLPELANIEQRGWLDASADCLRLTPEGIENSDVVGPMLYSELGRSRMREFLRRC